MRTNIEIDDKLMEFVMATGDYKTKREAVEAGLQLIKRRKAYDALLAARGTLFWDDSDEAWARRRAEFEAEEAQAGALAAGQTEGTLLADPTPDPIAASNPPEPALAVCESVRPYAKDSLVDHRAAGGAAS